MLQSIGKKLMVALATIAMVVGSLLTTATPAFAAGANGSIAVTGNDGFQGIVVYRMFDQGG